MILGTRRVRIGVPRGIQVLSIGHGTHCCARCREKPGKHDRTCKGVRFDEGSATAEWSLAKYGSIDVEFCAKIQLPVPRWLIPNAILRWALPLVCRILYPLFLLLNEAFESTEFSERALEDRSCWFAAISPRIERAQAALRIPRTFSL